MTNPHKNLLNQFCDTCVSWRAAAKEMGISRTVLHEFLHGRRPAAKKNPEPVIRAWIKSKKAEKRGSFKTKPALKRLSGMSLSVAEAAEALGLRQPVLYRALTSGEWPSEEAAKRFEQYLANQKERRIKKMITKISLHDEVLKHFELDRDPFTNEMGSEEDILDLKEIARAERKILNAVEKNGWVAVTGDVGSGKTTLIKKVKARLAKRKEIVIVEPRTIEKQFLGAGHVCLSILRDLGMEHVASRHDLESKARLVAYTLQEASRDGKKVVLLIDEAHLLRADALLALKRLYEFEFGFKKLLAIVLVGQVALARRLKMDPSLREVSQRIDLYELNALNGQLAHYLEFKLQRGGLNGASAEIFDKAAIKAIGERADVPLSVNNLAAAAMIAAWDLGEKRITGDIVKSIPGTF